MDPIVDIVIKLGGGVLARADLLDRVLTAIGAAARDRRLLIVPGGGPFADAVRDVDARLRLSDDAAHWMAILAMDQYAHVIATRRTGTVLVTGPHEIEAALRNAQVPVLAPSRWLQTVDPLPHLWDVTSDSIAAWVAGELHAARLVLIKPSGAAGDGLTDGFFARALPSGVSPLLIPADDVAALGSALGPLIEST